MAPARSLYPVGVAVLGTARPLDPLSRDWASTGRLAAAVGSAVASGCVEKYSTSCRAVSDGDGDAACAGAAPVTAAPMIRSAASSVRVGAVRPAAADLIPVAG